jgi:signal transduction histidine kinase
MTIGRRINRRLTRLAVGPHLPRRAVRVRLTVLYGGLFLLSGAALMAIAYALLVSAGFVFSLQNNAGAEASWAPPPRAATATSFPTAGSRTHPSAQTTAYWREVALCMRRHGVSSFPEPTDSVPLRLDGVGMVSDRSGAILVFPATIDTNSARFTGAANACGFYADSARQITQEDRRRTGVRDGLLLQSGIALAGMSLLSLGLGWLMAGRVLQPLEAAYEAQRRFVATASHELRAPLTRQRALTQVALADPGATFDSLREAHERVLVSEQHLEQMIEGLLALTRGQAGVERREELDLADLALASTRARQSDMAQAALDVRTSLASAPTIGDPRLVERLVANLIDNATRHNTPGGHVEISTGTCNRRAFLSVANAGPMIPPGQVPRLFEPFQRLEGRTRHNSGHGLGLSIVQAIAQAHRAELSVNARPQGGLAVAVSFPASSDVGPSRERVRAWISSSDPRPHLQD